MPPTSIDGTDITGATIDGTDVTEITVDGQTVFSAVLDVPDTANLRSHYDAKSLTGFSDGNTVSTWPDLGLEAKDLSGNGTYRSSAINGNPAIEFDGSTTEYGPITYSTELSQPNMIYVVLEHENLSGNFQIVDSSDNTADNRNLVFISQGKWAMFGGGGVIEGSSDLSILQITAKFDGSNSILREEGTQTASGNVGSDAKNGVFIGSRGGNDRYMDGLLGEVLVYDTDHDSTTIGEVESYLNSRWGI